LLLLASRHGARNLPPAFLQPRKILVDQFRQLLSLSPADQLTATLESLAALRDKGLITPDEYEAKKRDLLERM